MTVMIEPGLLAGAVTPPPSKSQAHRLLIARALAGENIDDPAHRADSQDIRATRDCLKSLREGEGELPVLECGESGSTLRFLIPVALAAGRRHVSGTGEADGPAPGALLPDL